MSTALYIITNDRLSKSQRIPQAAHATAEFMHEHGQVDAVKDWVKIHRTMVCLRADEETLERISSDESLRKAHFVDEDLANMKTAVAVGPLDRETGAKLFGHLQLA